MDVTLACKIIQPVFQFLELVPFKKVLLHILQHLVLLLYSTNVGVGGFNTLQESWRVCCLDVLKIILEEIKVFLKLDHQKTDLVLVGFLLLSHYVGVEGIRLLLHLLVAWNQLFDIVAK